MGNPSKEEVVNRLKFNPKDFSLLNRYLDWRQVEVDEDPRSGKAALDLNVDVAEIKRDAGLYIGAYEAFLDAAEHAYQEREDKLYEYCCREAKKLEGYL